MNATCTWNTACAITTYRIYCTFRQPGASTVSTNRHHNATDFVRNGNATDTTYITLKSMYISTLKLFRSLLDFINFPQGARRYVWGFCRINFLGGKFFATVERTLCSRWREKLPQKDMLIKRYAIENPNHFCAFKTSTVLVDNFFNLSRGFFDGKPFNWNIQIRMQFFMIHWKIKHLNGF